MKRIRQIVLTAKDETCDWRAFVHCFDSKDTKWELRAYGKTPDEAAKDAWERFNDTENNWDIYGYQLDFTSLIS